MQIEGVVHCLFEQSGTFKNEFIKLGYQSFDYDIRNEFGQTDCDSDIFEHIELAYDDRPSLFDGFDSKDLILAFFPCTYFSCMSQMFLSWNHKNYAKYDSRKKTEYILERVSNRERFFSLCVKLHSICIQRGLRMIMENPWSEQAYLKSNFIYNPTIIDYDRTKRGDRFVKPTAYWFVNCEPTHGSTHQQSKKSKNIVKSNKNDTAGLCSTERSMITSDYARNFICDFIIGKSQPNIDTSLFDLI